MGKSKKFSDREKTRADIIQKSAILFNKKGYLSTSIGDIEKCTGFSRGSIYGNFDSKEEVALEAFRYNFRQMFSGIKAMVDIATTAKDKLLAYPRYHRQHHPYYINRGGCVVLNTSIDADDTNPALSAKAVQYIGVWEKSINYILDLGETQDEWKAPINRKAFFARFVGLIQGGIFLTKTTGDDEYLLSNLALLEEYIEDMSK
ncbi:TetR/AcrR family transcriptional regulator [uncultured Microscilla sp.]|uniref:TetR/AcrR family transcriptional regulator n=1 Tax=uncultured Microscilla sp. TaxID=432653 RepID=UPI0026070BB1|nr:TetR/AcrR family transcriptional regulator [uncultured Microscilla sp.]